MPSTRPNLNPALLSPALLAPVLLGLLLPPAACERKTEKDPPTVDVELNRRRESLMDQMDKIAEEHEQPPAADAPASDPPASPPDAGAAPSPPPPPPDTPETPPAGPESPVSPP